MFFSSPILTMMHLCIMLYTHWAPLTIVNTASLRQGQGRSLDWYTYTLRYL